MPLNLRPHHYEIRSGVAVVTKVMPYKRIRLDRDTPPIFIQNGKFWSDEGAQITKENLPDGFWKYMERFSDESLRKVGLGKIDEDRPRRGRPPKESTDGGESGIGQVDS